MSLSLLTLRVRKVVLSALRQALYLGSFRFYCRVLLLGIVLINGRSFPLIWHIRVVRHLIGRSLRYHINRLTPRRLLKQAPETPKNPFVTLATYKCWAGPDDCDFLFHLSNSSYAKNLDVARAQICSTLLASFMQEGGWTPLAAADYTFVSEIPLLANYEIRSRIGSWDNKWIYLLSEFVTYPGQSSSGKDLSEDKAVAVGLATKKRTRPVRSDGSVLHCVAVSVYCFKMGRITVPPTVALSMCGFGTDTKNISRIAEIRKEGKMRQFLEGGWRHESGWDLPEFEAERQEGLTWCCKLTEATQQAIVTLNDRR